MSLSERFHRSVERALENFPEAPPTPLRSALYRDVYATWMESRGPAVYDLHDLLLKMMHGGPEVKPADDEQIRLAYGIRRKA